MLVERGGVLPCLTNHEHIRSCGALEHIVGDAPLMFLRQFGKGYCRLQGSLVLLAVIGLEKTIQPYHIYRFLITLL